MSGVHVIRRQTFQFELEEAAQYRMLSERIRMLGDRVLPEALDKILSEFVPDDVHLVIDRLELDIGTLRPEELIDQLVPRIMSALRTALQAVRDGRPSTLGVRRVEEGPERQAAILGHFVLHGRLPWWAAPKNLSIQRMAGELLLADPVAFGRIFDRVRQDTPRLRRLLQHLDTAVIMSGLQRTRPANLQVHQAEWRSMVAAVIRQLQTTMGGDQATETVRLHLLQILLASDGRSDIGHPSGMSAAMSKTQGTVPAHNMPIPLRAFVDQLSRSNTKAAQRIKAGQHGIDGEGSSDTPDKSIGTPGTGSKRKPKADSRGMVLSRNQVIGESFAKLEAFGGYLQEGRLETQRVRSMAAEVVQIFTTLIEERLPELSGMIRDLGRAERVRRRILDSIPSPKLRSFFAAAVPGKREAIEWVESVYLETQRKVRPINQTNIRVQRSVDEITLELFTTTDLNAMGNAAFLRFHVRKMALKHHIRYRDLIRAIWRSSSLFDVSPDGRLYQILKALYEEAFPPLSGGRRPDADGTDIEDGIGGTSPRDPEHDSPTPNRITYSRERINEDLVSESERRFLAEEASDATSQNDGTASPGPSPAADERYYRSGITEEIRSGTARGLPEEASIRQQRDLSFDGSDIKDGRTLIPGEQDGLRTDLESEMDRAGTSITERERVIPKKESGIKGDTSSAAAIIGGALDPGQIAPLEAAAATGRASRELRPDDATEPSASGTGASSESQALGVHGIDPGTSELSGSIPQLDKSDTRETRVRDGMYGIPVSDEVPEGGGVRTPLDLLEPVPAGLLDMLPRAVVRALILIKGTQVFGRHTRALQELISTYIRLSAPPQLTLENIDVPALLAALTDYLGVEPEFLLFAFRYSAGVHPGDALAQAVSERLSPGQSPLVVSSIPSGTVDEDGLNKLVTHLSAYRWYYEASHVKALLLPALKGRKIPADLFFSLIRLLYDDQAERVEQEWSRITGTAISPGLRRDPEALMDEARHTFVEATLSGSGIPFSLPRIFSRVRNILQQERTGTSVLAAGLSDIRGYFSPAPAAQSAGGGRKAAIRREHSILRFYHILNLDLVLQGVGDRFFDNIPFSFELLLTKHRSKLLEILRDHRFDAELAHFFAHADPSGIFEQIRRLLPSAQTDRISRLYRQAVEILLRSRWLTLGRNELTAFAGMDAYPFYLSPDLEPPSLSEVVFEIMRRGAVAGLLSTRFKESLAGATDAQWMAQIARSIGVRRRDMIFPLLITAVPGSPERIGIARYRHLLQTVGSLSVEETAALTLRAILDTGRFPEGHVLRAANPESHPDYLKRLAGIGNVVERVFSDAGEGYAVLLSGLLDSGQLIRAVAARFRLRRDQVRTLTRTWYERSANDGWRQEEFLKALLQAPVSSGRSPGRYALNRAAFKLLRNTGRIGWWEMLSALEDPQRATDASLDGLKPEDVTDALRGSREDWMELYFGLSQSTRPASGNVQRALSVWMRALAIRPSGGTRRQRFRSLVDALMVALLSGSPDPDLLHRRWLEAQLFFEGSAPSAVGTIYQQLIRAGMPEEVLKDHLRSRNIDIPAVSIEVPPPTTDEDISFQERLLRGTITPEALAALWRPGSRDAAQILAVLKSWVAGRHWNARTAERLARALPPQAMALLLERLSPAVDLRRIIENWSVFLQSAGLYPDRQLSATAIRRAILIHRLWIHQTSRRLQVELFQRMGLPEALHRGDIPEDILAEGIDGVPPVFLKMAADLLATRSGITTDELLALWPAGWTATAKAADTRPTSGGGKLRPGSVIVSPSVLDFLESGILPFIDAPETGDEILRGLMADIRSVGPVGFLTLPSLHESLVPRVLEFFRPEELTRQIFSSLIEKTTDAALRRYLEAFADLALHSRVRQAELIRFLQTYRRFFAVGGSARPAQAEAFLRSALVIPAFAQLTRRTLSALPRSAWRATRSPFLQFIVRRHLKERGIRLPDTDALMVFFLRTGLLHPDAVEEDLPAMYRKVRQHLSGGDPDLRATIFLYAKDRMARRRIREIFGGLEESDLYEWILPGLTGGLRRLTDLLRMRFGIDIWRAAGARSVRDRQERVLAWWSQTRPGPIHAATILKAFMEQVMAAFDQRQWQRIRQTELSSFTDPEKRLWNELRALLPALIEAPADAERKLAPPVEEELGPRMNEPDTDSDPADGITVQNGGLVILWPYLGRLFTRLGLSDGKSFPGEEEQSRAIRLTEYLVTGSMEMEEHQLALNKLLCGAPLEFQVPATIELTPEEEELCGKMLQGVIRNWEKLKTTRPNTFRETFLKREARLYKVEDRWELVVSRKPYDMLLDSLPWNISMIQLSWMPERLVVHWK